MSDDYKKPFTKSYVLKVTAENMQRGQDDQKRCVQVSIDKTLNRISDFVAGSPEALEVTQTLAELNNWLKLLESHIYDYSK